MRPTDDQLRRFLLGTLPADEADQVASWVEATPDAAEVLARVERPDTFAAALADTPGESSPRPRRPTDLSTADLTDGVDTDDRSPSVSTATAATDADPPTRAGLTATRPPTGGAGHPPPDLPPGYQFIDELGRGGMGVVYRARDLELDREVAVKVLGPNVRPGSSGGTRFRDEARITGQLQHPGIPPVYRVGVLPDGRPFLAMKLIKGRTLAELLAKTPVEVNRLGVFEGICQAVGYAHAHGVIHRDLKPTNVMVGNFGEVQVMDWGLAKVLTPSPSPGGGGAGGEGDEHDPAAPRDSDPTKVRALRDSDTKHGSVLGTPAFMAPEQAIGAVGQFDRRTDVFGLGGILCVLLTGRPPYVGADGEATRLLAARAKLGDCHARLGACGAEPELIALCKRCLSGEPDDRPADGTAVAAAVGELRAAADERARRAETAAAEGAVREAEGRKRRRVLWVAVAAVMTVLAGGVIGTGLGLFQADDARRKEEQAKQAEGAAREKEKERADEAVKAKQDAKERTDDAVREKETAKRATKLAQEQTALAEAQRARAEGLLLSLQLQQGRDAIQAGNIKLAAGLLNDCQWNLRGWEYRHLWTRVTPPQSFRMESMPTSLCFSADGLSLAASARAGKNSVVRVWALDTGAMTVLPTAAGEWSVSLAAGGKDELFGVRPDLVVQKWDLRSGQRTDTSTGKALYKDAFPEDTHVCFSPDRKWVAYSPSVGGLDFAQQVKVWDVEKGELARKLSAYKKSIHTVQFSPKGTQVASSAADQTVRLWDLEADAESTIAPFAGCSRLWFTPDGKHLLTTAHSNNQNWLKRWNIADKKAEPDLPWDANLHDLAFSPDGRLMATGEHDGRVRVWEVATAKPLRTYSGHTSVVHKVQFSPDGKKLASADYSGLVNVWDAERDTATPTLTAGKAAVRTAAFAPDGKTFVTGDADGRFTLWDAEKATRIKTLAARLPGDQFLGEVWDVAYSPDGKYIATCGFEVKLWDAKTGDLVRALTGHVKVIFHLAFSPDGKRLYCSPIGHHPRTGDASPADVWVWEVETGKKLAQFTAAEMRIPSEGGRVDALAFSPAGELITACIEPTGSVLKFWDTTDHTLVRTVGGLYGRATAVVVNPAGTRMAVSAADEITLWDTKTWERVGKARVRGGSPQTVLYSKDGTRLFFGCPDGSVRVWDADTLQELLSLPGHGQGTLSPGGDVRGLALSPDGTRLVSGGTDGTIRIWESLRSPDFADLTGHRQAVTAVAFSADGSKVYGWDKTGEVLAWHLRDGSPADPADAPEDRQPGPLTSPDGRVRVEPTGSTFNGGIAVRVWFLPPVAK